MAGAEDRIEMNGAEQRVKGLSEVGWGSCDRGYERRMIDGKDSSRIASKCAEL
jgi:hypothetical protein